MNAPVMRLPNSAQRCEMAKRLSECHHWCLTDAGDVVDEVLEMARAYSVQAGVGKLTSDEWLLEQEALADEADARGAR